MPGEAVSRDLAVSEVWESSYARSRARRERGRRGRRRRAAGIQAPPTLSALLSASARKPGIRDLTEAETWQLSLGRSRARRRAQQLRFVPAGTMAKRISLGTLVALAAGPSASMAEGSGPVGAPAGPPTTTEHSILLMEGSEGRQVELLQKALGKIKVDGVFGPETETAVEQFQEGKGLSVDGVVGPQTSAALRGQTAAAATFASFNQAAPGEAPSAGSSTAAAQAARELATYTPANSGVATGSEGAQTGSDATGGVEAGAGENPGEAGAGDATTAAAGTGAASALDAATGTTAGATGSGGTEAGSGAEAGSTEASTRTEAGAGSEAGAGASASSEAVKWDAVTRLQAALHVTPDGDFGPETEAAIKRLQARHGLAADGVVGPATWNVVGVGGEQTLKPPPSALVQQQPANDAASATDPQNGPGGAVAGANTAGQTAGTPASGGSTWDAVTRLQAALHLTADGEFGPETEASIRRLQARHGLNVDGVVGPATWELVGISGEQTLTPSPSAVAGAREEAGATSSAGGGGAGGESSSAGGGEGVVARVIAAADEIATRPYVYGGGHGSFESEGYDCSGSVSYALHGGGLLSSPEDSTGLESYGEAGPGKYITIYANAEHAYMTIDGRRYDTVALAEDGSRWSNSAGDDGGGFVERHPAGL
jgi:peptidoglycan hydrolase-like protein with peptidoglycan-binding domain